MSIGVGAALIAAVVVLIAGAAAIAVTALLLGLAGKLWRLRRQ